jgi:hypothetical protein
MIFELGSLRVCYMDPPSYVKTPPDKKYVYWFDAQNLQGFGPFDTIYAAMKHYALIVEQRKQPIKLVAPEIRNNIVYLDFKAKKKLT